jgi:hypothetical protein
MLCDNYLWFKKWWRRSQIGNEHIQVSKSDKFPTIFNCFKCQQFQWNKGTFISQL